VLAIDVDDEDAFERYIRENRLELPATRVHGTGSGRRHLLYQYPDDGHHYGNRSLKAHGFDIRGLGGQIVAPGSIHPETGSPYTVIEDTDLTPAPDWLLQLALQENVPAMDESMPTRTGTPITDEYLEQLPIGRDVLTLIRAGVPKGQRSEAGMRVICALLAAKVPDGDIMGIFEQYPIGDKYTEKGTGRVKWLRGEISRARSFLASHGSDPASILTPDGEIDPPHPTDMGNAERLVRRHGMDLRYCAVSRHWLMWDDTRWARDETGSVVERAKDCVLSIYAEAGRPTRSDDRQDIAKHAMRSEADARIRAMIDLAKSNPVVAIRADDLDRDPWLLNAANGTLDVKSGALHPHRRGDLITKLAPVEFDPEATCPRWEEFLRTCMQRNRNLIEFLQRAAGYCLTGVVREQVMILLYGTGANGKSTFLNTLRALLGDYAQDTPARTFLAKRSDSASNDLAALKGARLCTAIEAGKGRRLDEELVKRVTGGDPVTARYLYGEYFTYHPGFKLWLAVNDKPRVEGTDEGIWRRIQEIPFTYSVPEAERDLELAARLREELPGILNWALAGCRVWDEEGLNPPPEVTATGGHRGHRCIPGRHGPAIGLLLRVLSLRQGCNGRCRRTAQAVSSMV
jgi:putative DNA primase/helicase